MSQWIDPVKNRPPKNATLNIKGDFHEFMDIMRKVINKQEEKPKPASASHDPDAS